MELVVNASNSITPTLPMICLIWESKARDQRKSAFFLLSLFVCRISIYASNFHLTYDFFLLLFFCFWMWTYDLFEVWKKKRISLSRKIWCFFVLSLFWERKNSSHFGQCLLHRYFWVHIWPNALQVRLRLCKTILLKYRRICQSLGSFIVHVLMSHLSSLTDDNHYYLSCDVPMRNTF